MFYLWKKNFGPPGRQRAAQAAVTSPYIVGRPPRRPGPRNGGAGGCRLFTCRLRESASCSWRQRFRVSATHWARSSRTRTSCDAASPSPNSDVAQTTCVQFAFRFAPKYQGTAPITVGLNHRRISKMQSPAEPTNQEVARSNRAGRTNLFLAETLRRRRCLAVISFPLHRCCRATRGF